MPGTGLAAAGVLLTLVVAPPASAVEIGNGPAEVNLAVCAAVSRNPTPTSRTAATHT